MLRRPSSGHLLSCWRKGQKNNPYDDPEELDEYQLERSVAGDQELPTITYLSSDVEINQPAQNQEENYTG